MRYAVFGDIWCRKEDTIGAILPERQGLSSYNNIWCPTCTQPGSLMRSADSCCAYVVKSNLLLALGEMIMLAACTKDPAVPYFWPDYEWRRPGCKTGNE